MSNTVLRIRDRVSLETSFDSKQPKLEPKLVSALSETKHLFRLFRFYTETESFDVSIEPKQTEDQMKQLDREHILLFFAENLRFFGFFFVSFLFPLELFLFASPPHTWLSVTSPTSFMFVLPLLKHANFPLFFLFF
jgi:hypothetical protein